MTIQHPVLVKTSEYNCLSVPSWLWSCYLYDTQVWTPFNRSCFYQYVDCNQFYIYEKKKGIHQYFRIQQLNNSNSHKYIKSYRYISTVHMEDTINSLTNPKYMKKKPAHSKLYYIYSIWPEIEKKMALDPSCLNIPRLSHDLWKLGNKRLGEVLRPFLNTVQPLLIGHSIFSTQWSFIASGCW